MTSVSIPALKVRMIKLTLNGQNVLQYIASLSIYETIYKPYHTASLVVEDNNNVIENLNLKGGEPCEIVFDSGEPSVYENTLYVFSLHGQKSRKSARSATYTIELIGPEYFSDRKGLVQRSFKDVPATSAIVQIFNEHIGGSLKVKMPSIGPISKEGFIKSAVKPFRAIDDIKKFCNFGGKGNCMFFKDIKSCVLSPLGVLFDTMGTQEVFNQIVTIGVRWPEDILRERNMIIVAVAEVDISKSGRGGSDALAAASSQEQKTFDLQTKNKTRNQSAGGGGGNFPGMGGNHGGFPNYSIMDGAHQPTSIDGAAKTVAERLEAAKFDNNPWMRVKVPIQSGMNCTVGNGIELNLLPPMGDYNQYGKSDMSGKYLVCDLSHDLVLVEKTINGTTTMNAAKKG